MGWNDAWKAKAERVPRWVKEGKEERVARWSRAGEGAPDGELSISPEVAATLRRWDPLSRVALAPATSGEGMALWVETFDAAGESFCYSLIVHDDDVTWGDIKAAERARECLSRLYTHPKRKEFDPNDSPEDAEQAVRVAETKAWAARKAWSSTRERRYEAGRKAEES